MDTTAEPIEVIQVDRPTVACDGGDDALGHPRVFLNLLPEGRIDCPYCGRRYVLNTGKGEDMAAE